MRRGWGARARRGACRKAPSVAWPPRPGRTDVAAAVEAERQAALNEALAAELDALAEAGLRRRMRGVSGRQGAEVVLDGQRVVDFSSNDYLGLAADPRLAEAA